MVGPNVLKAGLGCSTVKGFPPATAMTGRAKFSLEKSEIPGGSCRLAISEAEASAHSAFDKGWMVANAGPATAIINAITIATVTSKMMRFIGATSFVEGGTRRPRQST